MNDTVPLPKDLVRDLEHIQAIEPADQPTIMRKLLTKAIREWKLDYQAQAYATGKTSLARAAQEADSTLWEMMEYVRSHKISAQYDRDDLEHDIKEIYDRLG